MTIPPRHHMEYPGANYHVLARGNRGNRTFLDDRHFSHSTNLSGNGREKTGREARASDPMGAQYHIDVLTSSVTRDVSRAVPSLEAHGVVTHEYDRHRRIVASEIRDRSGKLRRVDDQYDERDRLVSATETWAEVGEPHGNRMEGETHYTGAVHCFRISSP